MPASYEDLELADLVVLSDDYFSVPEDRIADIGALTTEDLIDPGEIVAALRLPTAALDAAAAPPPSRRQARCHSGS